MAEKRRYSVLTVLLAGFSVTSVLGVGIALYVGLGAAFQNTRNLGVMLSDLDLTSVQRTMRERMDSVGERSRWVADQVAQGTLDPSDQYGWDNTMRALAASRMEVMAYGLISGDREFIGYRPKDMSEIRRILPADDMIFSELAQIRGPGINRSSFPKWDPFFNQTVLADWIPLFFEGHYVGTFIQYLSLSNLSNSLIRGREDLPGVPFVLVAGNRVMAHPRLSEWGNNIASRLINGADIARSPIPLPTINDIGDPVLANIGKSRAIKISDDASNTASKNLNLSELNLNGRYSLIVTKQILDRPFSPIVLGIHFEEEVFDDEWNRLILASILGGGVLLLSIIVAIIISRHFTRPIRRFAAAARAFEQDGIDHQTFSDLQGSRIREYDDAIRSFNHMIRAVHDRERITSLFGKFLPASIARKLLASGTDSGVLPPQQCEATVLFVDIEAFTSLCETLDPQQIVSMLNAYFDCTTNIIEEHGGIITQFQGDAILAVFNAFDELNDHADATLDSAIAIQHAVNTRQFDGLSLRCRCGVNTGRMIAGNVGASARLSFTVHGDAVNTASRLERENKVLGTRILLSDSTHDQLSDPERVVKAGTIQLRGRHSETVLYTCRPQNSR